ncbi:MAG: hypothetical protein LWW85_09595 [Marinilabiliales bacterium]|nr:hypothetical protein [Marinilabiliales bacterium]
MKTRIFPIALLLALSSLLFTSCSKDSGESEVSSASLTAGKSDITFSYSGDKSGSFTTNQLLAGSLRNATFMNISAGNNQGTTVYSVTLFVESSLPAGTYNFKTLNAVRTDLMTFSITEPLTNKISSYTADTDANSDFTLNITKSDATAFEGSFSGTLKSADGKSLTVTNGKVAAKF